MKSIFLCTAFILFSCGTSSVVSSSNLQKRKHAKGFFVKKRGVQSFSRTAKNDQKIKDVDFTFEPEEADKTESKNT